VVQDSQRGRQGPNDGANLQLSTSTGPRELHSPGLMRTNDVPTIQEIVQRRNSMGMSGGGTQDSLAHSRLPSRPEVYKP